MPRPVCSSGTSLAAARGGGRSGTALLQRHGSPGRPSHPVYTRHHPHRQRPPRGRAVAAPRRSRRARGIRRRSRSLAAASPARRHEPTRRRRGSRTRPAPAREALPVCREAAARERSPRREARRTPRAAPRNPLAGRHHAHPDGAPRAPRAPRAPHPAAASPPGPLPRSTRFVREHPRSGRTWAPAALGNRPGRVRGEAIRSRADPDIRVTGTNQYTTIRTMRDCALENQRGASRSLVKCVRIRPPGSHGWMRLSAGAPSGRPPAPRRAPPTAGRWRAPSRGRAPAAAPARPRRSPRSRSWS